jgi:MFS family permease
MGEIQLNYYQTILVATLIGVGIGILLGLIPLILGIRRKKKRLGVYGFICSTVGGALSSILSLLIVGVFIWLILKNPAEITPNSTETSDSNIS